MENPDKVLLADHLKCVSMNIHIYIRTHTYTIKKPMYTHKG